MTDTDESKPHVPAPSAPGRKNSLVPSATGIRRAAMDWLARREHARCEIEQKLHRRFPDATAAIGPVLDQLEHEGLLSDARFVESFTRSRIQRGHGPRRIEADLRARGLRAVKSEEASAETLQDSEPEASAVAGIHADSLHDEASPSGSFGAADFRATTKDTDWLAVAREARRRRFGEAYPAGPVERNRQMAFLLRRGFSASVCREACVPSRDD